VLLLPMPGQLWVGLELPEEGVVVELPVDPLDVDPLDADPLEDKTLVVWALDDEAVVVAVAADTPRPRLRPRALAAMPAARNGRLSFIGNHPPDAGPIGPPASVEPLHLWVSWAPPVGGRRTPEAPAHSFFSAATQPAAGCDRHDGLEGGRHTVTIGGTRQRVLVVDDEPSIIDAVATSLRYEGFEVDEAASGRSALASAQAHTPDMIVLDIMLPDLDGLEVTRRLRADGIRVPILFLTARDGLDDKVTGLTIGGDDYVTKPFSLAEMVARTHAILRRTGATAAGDTRLRFADVEMDEETHEVWRAGRVVQLTATEFSLLRYFLLNPRRVLSKAQILDHVWHYDFGGEANIVETYVSYLRKKLDASGPPLIHTIRLVGYALREPG
jgi:two-component system OmpR family response regulator